MVSIDQTLRNRVCVLCRDNPSSPTGEHVIPDWLSKRWGLKDGPYTFRQAGQTLLSRDETPWTLNSFTPLKLPMCTTCNGRLDKVFEHGAKEPIRKLLNSIPTLDKDEAGTVGRWFVKTWLLLAHPEAYWAVTPPKRVGARPRVTSWEPPERHLYDWMTSDSPVPAGLSAWLVRRARKPSRGARRTIYLPTVSADDTTTVFRRFRCGLEDISVDLVYHPNWPIDHPLESEGRAYRLWPSPGGSLDLLSLQPASPDEIAWHQIGVHLRPGIYGTTPLPPLRATEHHAFFSASLQAFVFDLGPELQSGVTF